MSLYQCAGCGCVENTALSDYWHRKLEGLPLLCSECDPDIGMWHGQFDKRSAAGYLIDQSGNLWRTQEQVPSHYTIVGTASEITKGDK